MDDGEREAVTGGDGDFDSMIFRRLEEHLARMHEKGMALDEASDKLVGALIESLSESAPRVAQALLDSTPAMLADHRRHRAWYTRRIRRFWGTALDRYYAVAVAAEEAGSTFDQRHAPELGGLDHRFEALTGIYARACRTAFEVYHLLAGGFPLGALARCRTLHELAVNAIVIADYGEPDGEHPDLAERYIVHRGVLNWSDAQTYQSNSAITGYEPFTDDEMDAMREEHDDLIRRYGRRYKAPYGWAAGLVPGGRPNFRALESLAEVSFLRGHYQWASHEVHADAKGWALNVFEVNDTLFRATGPLDMGLAEPGHLALISLHQCLTALVFSTEEISPSDMLSCMAIQRLIFDAGDEFAKASDAVTEHYARAEARERRRAEPSRATD